MDRLRTLLLARTLTVALGERSDPTIPRRCREVRGRARVAPLRDEPRPRDDEADLIAELE